MDCGGIGEGDEDRGGGRDRGGTILNSLALVFGVRVFVLLALQLVIEVFVFAIPISIIPFSSIYGLVFAIV